MDQTGYHVPSRLTRALPASERGESMIEVLRRGGVHRPPRLSNGVNTTGVKRMTFQEADRSEPCPAHDPTPSDRFGCIGRAGRFKAAGSRE
jgi:hypothetical protein